MQRKAVKIKSDNPSHDGYYTQWEDAMQPGDILYDENPPDSSPASGAKIIKPELSTNKKRAKR